MYKLLLMNLYESINRIRGVMGLVVESLSPPSNLKLVYTFGQEFLNEGIGDDLSLMVYYVRFETSNYSEILYKGIDKVRAMAAFDRFDNDLTYYDDNMFVVMEGVVSHYKFIDDDIMDYPINDYYDDDTVYRLISMDEPEMIERRKVKPPNMDSDELLSDVQDYFRSKYGNRKYNKIMIGDICIQLRIADHTENIMNVDKYGDCDYYISVVVADLDKTLGRYGVQNKMERRVNEYELRYNSGDEFGDIIMGINNLIASFKKPQPPKGERY